MCIGELDRAFLLYVTKSRAWKTDKNLPDFFMEVLIIHTKSPHLMVEDGKKYLSSTSGEESGRTPSGDIAS